MSENLPSPNSDRPIDEISVDLSTPGRSNQLVLIGAPDWVKSVIHRLHNLGFAEAGHWSKLLPTRNPDEVISLSQWPRKRANPEVRSK